MRFTFRSFLLLLSSAALFGQPGRGPGSEALRQGMQLDLEGKGKEARAVFQKAIDTAPSPAAKANAERAMAISWAFEGNCRQATKYEKRAIAYWDTQQKENPGNAFYQQGELADEAGRVCIDAGSLGAAYLWYKDGHTYGLREPNISPARKDLWNYRWEHAQARLAARHRKADEAQKHVAASKAILDDMKEKDSQLYQQQMNFWPYLTGYVAFYGGDYKQALADLLQANQNDPFIQSLIGQSYEKLGEKDKALEYYRKASTASAHNPPTAYARPFAQKKLAELH